MSSQAFSSHPRPFRLIPGLFVSSLVFYMSARVFHMSSRAFYMSSRVFYMSSRVFLKSSRVFYMSSRAKPRDLNHPSPNHAQSHHQHPPSSSPTKIGDPGQRGYPHQPPYPHTRTPANHSCRGASCGHPPGQTGNAATPPTFRPLPTSGIPPNRLPRRRSGTQGDAATPPTAISTPRHIDQPRLVGVPLVGTRRGRRATRLPH